MIGVSKPFILLVNKFAEFYGTFNSKEPTSGLSLEEICSFFEKIKLLIASMEFSATKKLHAILHYLSNILKRGFFWNYSSFAFESYFNSLKKVARDCSTNPLVAIENFFSNFISCHFFSLTTPVLLHFGVEKDKIDLYKRYQDIATNRKPAFVQFYNLKYVENHLEKIKTFRSYSRTTIKEQHVTIERYSKNKKTNNHFALLTINEIEIYSKIIAIEEPNKNIYFKQGQIVEDDKEEIKLLFLDRFVKTKFESKIQVTSIDSFKKKIIAFEISGFCFFNKK